MGFLFSEIDEVTLGRCRQLPRRHPQVIGRSVEVDGVRLPPDALRNFAICPLDNFGWITLGRLGRFVRR
jgi:hypothetical protein